MTDREFIMPVPQEAAAMQMLIEQVRRLSDSVDRFTTTMSSVQQQLARMEKENEHTVERREKNEAWLHSVDKRVDALEAWQNEQKGERGFLAMILRSPLLGFLAAAGAVLWAVIRGKSGQ